MAEMKSFIQISRCAKPISTINFTDFVIDTLKNVFKSLLLFGTI